MDAAAQLQDVLGEHQDAAVAEERLRVFAATGQGGVGVGLLLQRELDRKAAARALRPVAWKKLRRAAKQARREHSFAPRAACPSRSGDRGLEVLVVHRPAYGDWTFPKGKCERGESDEDCALREVEEETGLVCELEVELPSTRTGMPGAERSRCGTGGCAWSAASRRSTTRSTRRAG